LVLKTNRQVIESRIEDNFENGEEYARLIKTPFQNPMLDRQVLRTKKKHVGHSPFLPQEVVQQDVWTKGLQRRHSSKQQSPQREM
jgi:hypothetical protein